MYNPVFIIFSNHKELLRQNLSLKNAEKQLRTCAEKSEDDPLCKEISKRKIDKKNIFIQVPIFTIHECPKYQHF
jgi:type I restriction-modification system DNA methylase subunit